MSLPIKATSKSIRAFCSSPIKVSSFQSSLKFVPITFPAFPNSPPSYVLHIPSLSSASSVFSCENDAAKQSDHQYKQKIKCAHAKDAIPTNHPPSVSYTAYPLLCHIPVKHEYINENLIRQDTHTFIGIPPPLQLHQKVFYRLLAFFISVNFQDICSVVTRSDMACFCARFLRCRHHSATLYICPHALQKPNQSVCALWA